MSRSPARAASVSSHTRKPSGSSVAIEPASTSCASGTRSRTIRNASITPTGSFHGSNRLTWHTIGRCTSTPYWRVSSWQNGIASSRFFTDSGSMHGGACTTRSIVERRGHELGHRPHRRVVQLDERAEELPHLRVGVGEVDVAAPDPLRVGHLRRRGARGGSSASPPAAGRGRPRSRTGRRRAARCRGPSRGRCSASPCVHSMSAPCSALCTALVTREELVAAVHHLPVGVDADAAEQRHVGREQLGDAAAVGGGVDVEDPRALQRLGQLAGSGRRRRRRPTPA